jgi:hypothetical protein
MFANLNWRWIIQGAIIIFILVLVPTVIIPGAAKLITSGIESVGVTIHDILSPLSRGGEDRLKGLVQLCLYLVFITVIVKIFIRK